MEGNEQPQSRKRTYKLKTDTIIAVSAVMISLCALIMTFMETKMMRTQQQASNYPHLIWSRGYSSDGIRITATNKGPGLAFIKTFYLWYEYEDGRKVYFDNWEDVADTLLPEGHQVNYGVIRTSTINDAVMTGGEQNILLKLPYSRDSVKYADKLIFDYIPELKYSICYCSILEECWFISHEQFTPKSCKSCKLNGETEFDEPVR